MPEISVAKSLAQMPEPFVSDKTITREVSRTVKAGKLRKLGSRLYTHNLVEPPEAIIARKLWHIVAGYFPGALISDRTELENAPASDGSDCLVTDSGRDIKLPGHILRPRRGNGPLSTDLPFIAGLFQSTTACAYLENMRLSRARGGLVVHTLGLIEIEEWLDTLIHCSGEQTANHLRDEILTEAPRLNFAEEARALDALISTLLGTHEIELTVPAAVARRQGAQTTRTGWRFSRPCTQRCAIILRLSVSHPDERRRATEPLLSSGPTSRISSRALSSTSTFEASSQINGRRMRTMCWVSGVSSPMIERCVARQRIPPHLKRCSLLAKRRSWKAVPTSGPGSSSRWKIARGPRSSWHRILSPARWWRASISTEAWGLGSSAQSS